MQCLLRQSIPPRQGITSPDIIGLALNMIARGKMTFDEISEDTGLSLEKVKELAEGKKDIVVSRKSEY